MDISIKHLPSNWENEIVKNDDKVCVLRSNVQNIDEIDKWVIEFGKKTNSNWIMRNSRPNCERIVCSKLFVCHHSSFNKVSREENVRKISKCDDCLATIKIKIKVDTENTRKKDPFVKKGLFGCISISKHHTHSLNTAEALHFLPPDPDVKEKFMEYFNDGMGIAESVRYHVSNLQSQENFQKVDLHNPRINPLYRTIRYWRDQWLEQNLGPTNGYGLIQKRNNTNINTNEKVPGAALPANSSVNENSDDSGILTRGKRRRLCQTSPILKPVINPESCEKSFTEVQYFNDESSISKNISHIPEVLKDARSSMDSMPKDLNPSIVVKEEIFEVTEEANDSERWEFGPKESSDSDFKIYSNQESLEVEKASEALRRESLASSISDSKTVGKSVSPVSKNSLLVIGDKEVNETESTSFNPDLNIVVKQEMFEVDETSETLAIESFASSVSDFKIVEENDSPVLETSSSTVTAINLADLNKNLKKELPILDAVKDCSSASQTLLPATIIKKRASDSLLESTMSEKVAYSNDVEPPEPVKDVLNLFKSGTETFLNNLETETSSSAYKPLTFTDTSMMGYPINSSMTRMNLAISVTEARPNLQCNNAMVCASFPGAVNVVSNPSPRYNLSYPSTMTNNYFYLPVSSPMMNSSLGSSPMVISSLPGSNPMIISSYPSSSPVMNSSSLGSSPMMISSVPGSNPMIISSCPNSSPVMNSSSLGSSPMVNTSLPASMIDKGSPFSGPATFIGGSSLPVSSNIVRPLSDTIKNALYASQTIFKTLSSSANTIRSSLPVSASTLKTSLPISTTAT